MMSKDLTKTSSYNYYLPQELIAQNPIEPRDHSRLLVMNREKQTNEHKRFYDIIDYLHQGDLLVLNDTRVLPARVFATKINEAGLGANIEVFFLAPTNNHKIWKTLIKPSKKCKPGTHLMFDTDNVITVGGYLDDGLREIVFSDTQDPIALIHKFGHTPLPHYIKSSNAPSERYQTVYNNITKENSVAAPTAGLHFTNELLTKIQDKGVKIAYVTLQVGLGTFRPVKAENIKDHIMHSELCQISNETAELVNEQKQTGNTVIAVGTTVVRTLESFAKVYGKVQEGVLDTRLFISPGYKFQVVDKLITNFHLPESTLLMLVSAFAGYDFTIKSYETAVKERYRFFSFGDSCFIC